MDLEYTPNSAEAQLEGQSDEWGDEPDELEDFSAAFGLSFVRMQDLTEDEEACLQQHMEEQFEYDMLEDAVDEQYPSSWWRDPQDSRRRAVRERWNVRNQRSRAVESMRPKQRGAKLPLLHGGEASPLRQVTTPEEAAREEVRSRQGPLTRRWSLP